MELNLNRLDEALFLFGSIMPLGSLEKQAKLAKAMNMNISIDSAIAILMRSIHTMMKTDPASALGYLDFIKQGIEYVFEMRDSLPEVDSSDEVLMKKMEIYRITKKDYEKND